MPVYEYNASSNKLNIVAGGTFYADLPIGSIIPYGGTTAPSGWLLCQGQAVSRIKYIELFKAIGTAFGEGDSSTTFNIPDLREATTKGIGLSGKSEHHYSENGVILGEFIEDRLQSHTHGIRNGFDGADPDSAERGDGRHGYSAKSNDASGRTGNTTEVKAVGVNYIIKAKQAPVPADFMNAVDEAIDDEFKRIQPLTYESSGFIINSSAAEITGYGRVAITLKEGIAEIKFSARIHSNNMSPSFDWGLNRDLLRNLIPELPYITPISNKSNLLFFAPTGAALVDLMGYGAMASQTNQFWTPARMYQTDGTTGTWASDQFPANSYITGTVYGTYTV